MKKFLTLIIYSLLTISSTSLFAKDFPNLLSTYTRNKVHVKSEPSINSEDVCVLNRFEKVVVAGFTDKKEVIDGDEYYWVKVALYNFDKDYYDFSNKYLLTKDIIIEEEKPSIMSITNFNREEETLLLNFKREKRSKDVIIPLNHLDGQMFYTFTICYDYSRPSYYYTDVVGTYVYDPILNEIKHITLKGVLEECKGNYLSNDYRYLFEDSGTSLNIRHITVTDLHCNEEIYKGLYSKDLIYEGNSINIVEVYDPYNKDMSRITKMKGEEYTRNLSDDELSFKDVIVKYRYNLDTNTKEFIGCELIPLS